MATLPQNDSVKGTDPVRLEDVLRTARESAGLSIRRAAERAGIHHAGLARIELGEQRPTPETLQRLAGALELNDADLFALAGYQRPEGLPSFPAYLRAKYDMPYEAAVQLNEYFGFLAEKYDVPLDGEPDAPSRPSR